MNGCTVTIRRRLPYTRVLAESFFSHHADGTFTALVLDEAWADEGERNGRLRILTPRDVGLSDFELHCLAMLLKSDDLVLATAPKLLKHLIEETGLPHVFIADDALVLGSLEDLEKETLRSGLLLTPRTTAPLPADDHTPDRPELLNAGLYDPGLVGASPEAMPFLDWWAGAIFTEATRARPRERTDNELRVNENLYLGRIFDMVPLYFTHRLAHDPGWWVSFWNVWGRKYEKAEGGWLVDGRPLRVFHFEGYRPDYSHLLGLAQGPRPRVLLSRRPELAELAEDYRARLEEAGFEDARKLPFGFEDLPGGLKVDARMRFVYRKALKAFREGRGPAPPDPFDIENPQAFVDWLNTADPQSLAPVVPRYLHALYQERLDLQAAYPGLARADAGKYLDWVMRYGARETNLPPELCRFDQSLRRPCNEELEKPTRPDRLRLRPHFPYGLNVAGYFKAELGVGEMARLVLSGVEQSGIPYSSYSYEAKFSRQSHPFEPVGDEFEYALNLICVNADELQPFVRDTGPQILEHRYTIGLWWWEVEDFPAIRRDTAKMFDEVWAGSHHVARAVSPHTNKPVHVVPIPIRKIDAPPLDRSALGLPDGFMFLFTFDFLSVFERKNPVGVVKAFTKAFREQEGPQLVIKSINGSDELHSFELLRLAAADRSDIKIIDGYLPPDQKDGLTAACDCYVSLHRAEGYGLGMAEAMALGKPIIATAYSGNLEFLNEENSYLVGHRLIPVPPGSDPYPEGTRWAEPDLDMAAEHMRRVYENRKEAEARGRRAREDALTIHSPARTASFIAQRTEEIWQQMRRTERSELPARVVKGAIRRIMTSVTGPSRVRQATADPTDT
jgi:glycosyltransferase involved in cell wall biosynthesis